MADLAEQIRVLPMKKMVAFLAMLAIVIAAGILLFTWMQKADFQLLYSNLSEDDAGAIVQKLNEMKIPYSTAGGGVMVPADKVYEVRLQLASQGLPQGGGAGFELFDKTNFTMTDFVQKLNYRRRSRENYRGPSVRLRKWSSAAFTLLFRKKACSSRKRSGRKRPYSSNYARAGGCHPARSRGSYTLYRAAWRGLIRRTYR